MNILTFLALQIDKIRGKPLPHATGPKKPSLSQQDSGIYK